MRLRKTTRGQATVETALALVFGILPLTFGLIAFAEIGWTYHALATLTRLGARYAATHCFQDSNGSNVVTWMTDSSGQAPNKSWTRAAGACFSRCFISSKLVLPRGRVNSTVGRRNFCLPAKAFVAFTLRASEQTWGSVAKETSGAWFQRRRPTNRWTGATGSDFRIKRVPAKLLGSAVARSTQPLGFFKSLG